MKLGTGRIFASLAGDRYLRHVEIVQAGRDGNGRIRTPQMLRASARLFVGRPVKVLPMVGADGVVVNDHQQNERLSGREVLNTVGRIQAAIYDEKAFGGRGGLVGKVKFVKGYRPAEDLLDLLEDGVELGLSFRGFGLVSASQHETIDEIESVDVVTHPAAGGRIGHRLAASQRTSMTLKKLIAQLKAKHAALVEGLPETVLNRYALARWLAERVKGDKDLAAKVAEVLGADVAKLGDEKTSLEETFSYLDRLAEEEAPGGDAGDGATGKGGGNGKPPAKKPQAPPPKKKPTEDDDDDTGEDAEGEEEDTSGAEEGAPPQKAKLAASLVAAQKAANEILVHASRQRLEDACKRAKLPTFAAQRLMASHSNAILTAEAADQIAKEKAEELDEVARSGILSRARVVEEPRERLIASLASMLSPRVERPKGLDPMRDFHGSFHKFMHDMLGVDLRELGSGMAARQKIQAAVDASSFGDVYANSLNRAFLAEFRGDDALYQAWRAIARIVPARDFRTQEVISPSYYDELPDVPEGTAYPYLTTPTDRKESYVLTKRGGLETITWEQMLNDDMGIWQKMLARLGRAAIVTLNTRVFKKIRRATQPTMADGFKLTSSSRTPPNEGTSALTGDATGWGVFVDSVIGMMAATGGSGEAKGIRPRTLVIPMAKAKAAGQLVADFSPAATDIPTRRGLEILRAVLPNVVVDVGATDANDWFLLADPSDAEVIRVAFLNGREDPELITSDAQQFGSMFVRDVIEVKVRHPYAVAAVDPTGIYGHNASA